MYANASEKPDYSLKTTHATGLLSCLTPHEEAAGIVQVSERRTLNFKTRSFSYQSNFRGCIYNHGYDLMDRWSHVDGTVFKPVFEVV